MHGTSCLRVVREQKKEKEQFYLSIDDQMAVQPMGFYILWSGLPKLAVMEL